MSPLWESVTALLLFAAAAACLLAELSLPAHGVLALLSACFAIAGIIDLYQFSPILSIAAAIVLAISQPFLFAWAVRHYPNSWAGQRILLKKPATSTPAESAELSKLAELVGKTGTALTLMRPAGACQIDNRRINAVSESAVIEAGTPIEVTRVVGTKVIVRPIAA